MPPKKIVEPEDLYLFVVEADQQKGTNEDFNQIVTKLVSDKIFSEKCDEVCIRRHDQLSHCSFETSNWDLLKKFHLDSALPVKLFPDVLKSLFKAVNAIVKQAGTTEYTAFKILYFGSFESYLLDGDVLKELQSTVEEHDIKLTMIFPVELAEMTPMQKENYDLLKKLVCPSKNFFLFTYKEALGKILNMVANKSKKSMPWNIVFELGKGLEIPVKKLIINRKNTTTVKSAFLSAGVEKETVWTSNDGATVDETDLGDAYEYGDCLVSTSDVGSEDNYASGATCLKLLQFVPRENIHAAYLIGEGIDMFFAQDNNPVAAIKLDALMTALGNLNRVAIVRRVKTKNGNAAVGVLIPDLERKGFIHADLCYADDISTPHFAPLIKEESLEGADGISEKDDLMDQLISAKTINEFNPEFGPVDPAVLILRQAIARKIILNQTDEDVKDVKLKSNKINESIDLFFEQFVLSHELTDKLKKTFPLKVNKETGADRPSGHEVFRKRGRGNEENENGTEKKIKVEDEGPISAVPDEIEPERPIEDISDLLDEL